MPALSPRDFLDLEFLSFARFLGAYKECTPAVQAIIDEMAAILSDPDADALERQHATDAMMEALFPGLSADVFERERHDSPEVEATKRELDAEEAAFGDRLRVLMKDRGWSQDDLAQRAGVKQPAISNLLNRRNRPQRRTILRLADALDMAPQALWPGVLLDDG